MALPGLEGQCRPAMMRVAIRVDASLWLGSGHVMRCLALAGELKSRGHHVVFLMRLLDGHLVAHTRAAGFEVLTLADFFQDSCQDSFQDQVNSQVGWLEMAQRSSLQIQDAEDSLALLKHAAWDWLVVDHYGLGLKWQQSVHGRIKNLMVIDDEADRTVQCDVLLNQNTGAHASDYKGLMPPGCLPLTGPHYALLRPEFLANATVKSGQDRGFDPSRLLVSLGGGDVKELLFKVLAALEQSGLRGAGITVVLGAQNPHAQALEQRCRALGFTSLKSTDTMAALMMQADWAIGAGGVGLLERCVMGLPSITLITAPNQRRGVKAAYAQCALMAFDPLDPLDLDIAVQLRQAIADMLASPDRLAAMSKAAQSVCDGRGTPRVADILQKGALTLRNAAAEDSCALYAWRNAAVTRKYSRNGQTITYELHQQWMQRVLANPTQRLWIASCAAGPVGVLRFDRCFPDATNVAEISVYRVPGQPSRGWGRALIASGIQEAQRIWPVLTRVDAHISDDNLASLAAFAACGFKESTASGLYQKYIERICP